MKSRGIPERPKLYLDLCAWKRPFDDQSNDRVWMETQAVMRLLELAHVGEVLILISEALTLENKQNPKPVRRDRVSILMAATGKPALLNPGILRRAWELRNNGFGDMDALHVASAEALGADALVTCDEQIIRRDHMAHVRIMSPVDVLAKRNTK